MVYYIKSLLVGKGSWNHIWALKAVLKAFELVSGLGINYHKSKLIGINFNKSFLEAAACVLGCKVEDSKFKFLVIMARYGDLATKIIGGNEDHVGNKGVSLWWNDLVKIGRSPYFDPFLSSCCFVPKNGFNTLFWESKWLNGLILRDEFRAAFVASRLKGVSVAGMGGWVNGDLGVPEGRRLIRWWGRRGHEEAFGLVWKAGVPFKIKAFGWRLLANRLPTKDLLLKRGISISLAHVNCAFCGMEPETRDHSFVACNLVKNIWKGIAFWIGKRGIEDNECYSSFMD
ncbi:uncharacterized protein LOC131619412 [Vicia villosa]|uniref:uncharacterized protein LOC131619412 n=1 Tax=Vicia villosa TaxID=3911 RepID=UPI00273BA19F|nr:uncharacterized protein LOC131619412 [Vicia villosa]